MSFWRKALHELFFKSCSYTQQRQINLHARKTSNSTEFIVKDVTSHRQTIKSPNTDPTADLPAVTRTLEVFKKNTVIKNSKEFRGFIPKTMFITVWGCCSEERWRVCRETRFPEWGFVHYSMRSREVQRNKVIWTITNVNRLETINKWLLCSIGPSAKGTVIFLFLFRPRSQTWTHTQLSDLPARPLSDHWICPPSSLFFKVLNHLQLSVLHGLLSHLELLLLFHLLILSSTCWEY